MSYTQLIYHIILRSKQGRPAFADSSREQLFKYIGAILRNKNCTLFQINGTRDHLHLLVEIHPCLAMADLIRIIKAPISE